MASDESVTIRSCISLQEDDYYDDDIDDGIHDPHQSHPHNFSRLSICTSRGFYGADAEDDKDDRNYYQADRDNNMSTYFSRLSIESFDDGDVEQTYYSSDDKRAEGQFTVLGLSSDSEKEAECYSLPATPPRRRRSLAGGVVKTTHGDQPGMKGVKEYASDNGGADHHKGQKKMMSRDLRKRRRRRRGRRDRLPLDGERDTGNWKNEMEINMMEMDHHHHHLHLDISGGESEGGGSSTTTTTTTTTLVITRPKGGRRSLCMDLEEVKACRDLGFELEHQRMLEMPTPNTANAPALSSTFDTTSSTSGGNSPIANWRISSPGT